MSTVRQLAPLFSPRSYNLTLNLTKRAQRHFFGEVTVTGTLSEAGASIVLHAKDMTITKASINRRPATATPADDDELHIATGQSLPTGEHTVTIAFEAPITNSMHGLYPSYFEEDGVAKELLSTQLESHHAREVFPCVDEPAAKAVFNLALITEAGVAAVANTPIAAQKQQNGSLVTIFEPTPRMSTYLLAFVVGELHFKEATTSRGVTVRAYATAAHIPHTDFALEFACKLLDYYDDFFGTPYPLPKCDLVCVPDFSAAAMENWGLVICRESCMLLDATNSSMHAKKWVAEVIAHELAHQWFGNLVTMQWWDDLWLNESFAKWMEYFSLDHFYPEWRVWEQFGGTEQILAFTRDSTSNVQAVRTPVNHPDELHSLFDPAIVYAKGSSLIRMLQRFVGAGAFREGLQAYMQKHAYSNATADDLWEALGGASNKDVKSFMLPWLTQPGHPVVKVEPTAGSKLTLTQQRFFANPAALPVTSIWPIPLMSEQLEEPLLDTPSAVVVPFSTPVLLNNGGSAFYHTQYSPELLEGLVASIERQQLTAIDRQMLLADVYALARAGLSSTVQLLELLAALRHETSYAVWQSVTVAIGGIKAIVDEHPRATPHLKRFIQGLALEQYTRLGWDAKPGESHFDQLLRPTVISLLAYAGNQEVTEHLLAQFTPATGPKDLPAELRTIIMGVAVRDLGLPAYHRLLDWYKTASGEERMEICTAIGDLRDPAIAQHATQLLISPLIKPQDLRFWFANFMRNRNARDAAWQWLQANWPWIEATFKNGHEYGDFPKYAAAGFSTEEGWGDYRTFFEPKQDEIELGLMVRQGIDEISARVAWRERDLAHVRDFLQKHPLG